MIRTTIISILVLLLHYEAQAKLCNNLPKGMSRLRNGVDITKVDLLPFDVTRDNGFRLPIIDFNCNEGKTRVIGQTTYDVPDEVISINSLPNGWLDADVSIYRNSKDITKKMSVNADVNVLGGLFTAGGSYTSMQNTITNSSKYIEDVNAFVSANKVSLYPFWGLTMSNAAQTFIKKFLRADIKRNVKAYQKFIEYFGTHYMEHGKYGGLIRLVMETDQSYYKSHSTRDVEAQARGSFFNLIKAGGGGGSSTIKIDSRFTKATHTKVRYYGGNTNLLGEKNGIPTWQPTVASNPWLFSGKLVPVTNFFAEGYMKKSMEIAVQAHIDLAYLRQLRSLLFSFKVHASLRGVIDTYKKQVDTLLKQDLPSHAAVTSLGRTIEDNLNAPTWYTEKTKFCYRWYPDGDGGQCGGGVGRLLCANPGDMTTYYRDDTDRRGGGCQMSWGIIPSDRVPSWFNDVQVCYKWWPDGDGGQCGGGAARLLCAKVGQYTPYYRDDTDRRGGGCRMQWKLVVPSSAPLWMRNARLCYEWYPDGDGGQCGGGAGRSLCAEPNVYTGVYRDDTDRRGGGCRMRWGIKIN